MLAASGVAVGKLLVSSAACRSQESCLRMRLPRAVLYPHRSVIQIRPPIGAAAPGWHCLSPSRSRSLTLTARCRKINVFFFFFRLLLICEIAAERNGERKTPQENDRDELVASYSTKLALALQSVSALWMLHGTFPCQFILSATSSAYAMFIYQFFRRKMRNTLTFPVLSERDIVIVFV